MKKYNTFLFIVFLTMSETKSNTTIVYNVNQCIASDGAQLNCENFGINSVNEVVSWNVKDAIKTNFGLIPKHKHISVQFKHQFQQLVYSFTPTVGAGKNQNIRVLLVEFSQKQKKTSKIPDKVYKELQQIKEKIVMSDEYSIVKVYRQLSAHNNDYSEWTDVANLIIPQNSSTTSLELSPEGLVMAETVDLTGNQKKIVLELFKTY